MTEAAMQVKLVPLILNNWEQSSGGDNIIKYSSHS
jgi:hypothetical protein